MQSSAFGKRLRASGSQVDLNADDDEQQHPRWRRRRSSTTSLTAAVADENDFSLVSAAETPTRRPLGNRFLPTSDPYSMQADYRLNKKTVAAKTKKDGKCKENKSLLLNPTKVRAGRIFRSVLGQELSSPRAAPQAHNTPMLSYSTPPRTPLQAVPSTFGPFSIPTTTNIPYSYSPASQSTRHLLDNPPPPVRYIDSSPFRVLDAPSMLDDYYCNVLDWSSTDILGVGLGKAAFIWHAPTHRISTLCSTYCTVFTAVGWTQAGSTLALGSADGNLRIYDAATLKLTRFFPDAHKGRIGVVSWCGGGNVLSSGSRDGELHHRDLRDRSGSQKPFKQGVAHKNEICGLKWSGDDIATANLASGGNDNRVCIWDLRGSSRSGVPATRLGSQEHHGGRTSTSSSSSRTGTAVADDCDKPVWKFREHKAAVKALAWNPHIRGVLATGGGSRDNHIQFWNTATGKMISEVDTGGQVCNLLWSKTSPEIVSTHGHSSVPTARNQIRIWQYPSLELQTSLVGHTSRVLYLAMNPDGQDIVTGSGDQTLRFWKVFPNAPKSNDDDDGEQSVLDYANRIR